MTIRRIQVGQTLAAGEIGILVDASGVPISGTQLVLPTDNTGLVTTPVGGTSGATAASGAVTQVTATNARVTLTQAVLDAGGPVVHINDGVTGIDLVKADWADSRMFHIANVSTSTSIPVTVGAGWTRARTPTLNLAAATGDLLMLEPGDWAIIQMSNGYLNVVEISGSSGKMHQTWAANTWYEKGELVYSGAVQGTVGIGDPIIRNVSGKSAATFDATEVTKWTEAASDPDVMLLAGAQTVTGVKTFSTLPELLADATTANQAIRKSQHDAAMALKANLASPALTGTPTALTAPTGTNTTQLATTAFTQQELAAGLATVAPLVDGTAAVGTSTKMARQDHVHPAATGVELTANKNAAFGYAGLDASGKVATAQLPTFVGDAIADGVLTVAPSQNAVFDALALKQAALVSGTNIKTVNSQSLVGSGNITIAGSSSMPTHTYDPITDVMANRTVHLRSNELTAAGALSSWTAAGGTSVTATQATVADQPATVLNSLNGLATADFTGLTDTMSVGTLSTGTAVTVIAVVQQGTQQTNGNTILGQIGGTQAICFTTSGGAGGLADGKMYGIHEFVSWMGGSTTAVPAGWNILGYVWDNAADLMSYFTNGSANGTATYTGNPVASSAYVIGGRNSANTTGLRGSMAEILVFQVVLSATERAKAEGYLAWKYGLQANLPAGHTYKSAAPTMLDIPVYANNAAAVAGLLAVGSIYRTGGDPDMLAVVH